MKTVGYSCKTETI